MYARFVDCKLQPHRRLDFSPTIRDKVLPAVTGQPGFVSLLGLISEEYPNHAVAVTVWNTKEDADRFYQQDAPMNQFLSELTSEPPRVEHFHLDASAFKLLVAGRAA